MASEIKKRRSSPSPSPTRNQSAHEQRDREQRHGRETDSGTDRNSDRLSQAIVPATSAATSFSGFLPPAPFLTWSPILLPPFPPALFPAFYPALRSLPGFVFCWHTNSRDRWRVFMHVVKYLYALIDLFCLKKNILLLYCLCKSLPNRCENGSSFLWRHKMSIV